MQRQSKINQHKPIEPSAVQNVLWLDVSMVDMQQMHLLDILNQSATHFVEQLRVNFHIVDWEAPLHLKLEEPVGLTNLHQLNLCADETSTDTEHAQLVDRL